MNNYQLSIINEQPARTLEGWGYIYEACLRRLKTVKPASAGFVCVAPPFEGEGVLWITDN